MDWSKIKTIFIITFLVLDIFLAKEFLARRETNQLDHITKQTVEDLLKENGIKYNENNVSKTVSPLKEFTATHMQFKEDEVASLKGQEAKIDPEKKKITSDLKEPIPINGSSQAQLVTFFKTFAKEYIFRGEEYVYWKEDKQEKEIYLIQLNNGEEIYANPDAQVIVKYDENRSIISYKQTMLESEEEFKVKKQKSALEALESLIIGNVIEQNRTIVSADLGYYRLINFDTLQMIGPVWYFVLDDGKEYYVHAIEGTKIEINENAIDKLNKSSRLKEQKQQDVESKEEIVPEQKRSS